jgi:hypothetical protein
MKTTVIKILGLFTFVFLSNCSSTISKNEITYKPSESTGCSSLSEVKARLKCIGELVKQIEDIRNSKISTNKEKMERIDNRFVKYRTTYCLTDKKESEKYFCFDSYEELYEPTTEAKIVDLLSKLGIGFVFGIATGVYIGN